MAKKSTKKKSTRKTTTKKPSAEKQERKLLESTESFDDASHNPIPSHPSKVDVVEGVDVYGENVTPDVKEVIPAPEKKEIKSKIIYLFSQPVVTVSGGKVTHLKKE